MSRKIAALAVLAILVVFLGMHAAVSSRNNSNEIASLNDEIASLKDALESAQSAIEDSENEIASLKSDIEDMQFKIDRAIR